MKKFDGLKTSIVFQAFLTILIFNAYQVFLFWHIKYRNCFCFFLSFNIEPHIHVCHPNEKKKCVKSLLNYQFHALAIKVLF